MAQSIHADTGDQVEILFSVGVIEPAALAALQRERADLLAGLSFPRTVVLFDERRAGAWGRPLLLGGLGWALAMMSIRRLGDAGESGVSIVIWFAIGSATVSGLATIPVWVTPDPRQWALLVAIGAVSAVAQLLMTEAYRRGETTLLAPFEYSGLLWTMALGAAFWGEWPGPLDLAGFAVLVGAGLFIWWRETRLGVRR